MANAANAQMLGCFMPFHRCFDNAIHIAAGPRLRAHFQTIMDLQGHDEETGSAKITRGYRLRSKFVLHTVGPIVPRGAAPNQNDHSALARGYTSCLNLAAETGLVRSVAFCGISTGVFGFPKEPAARTAVATMLEWLRQNAGKMDHVMFNAFDVVSTSHYLELPRN
ncbi:macro domain-containing protein [Ruegeria arenilitoris]|uniref:macro domain-containing protein n=1 Tax=Ruegeria arenilitoris TaxID=1173585 RepID=UPI003464D3D2